MTSLLAGSQDTAADDGRLGWVGLSPLESVRPRFETSGQSISVFGDHNDREFGYWSRRVSCRGLAACRLSLSFEVRDVSDISLHVLNLVLWHDADTPGRGGPHDYVSRLWRDGDVIRGEEILVVPEGAVEAEIQLGLRFCPEGRVTWHEIDFSEAPVPAARPARLSAVRWHGGDGASLESNRAELERLVDAGAAQKSDLVLLPEYATHNNTGLGALAAAESVPDGPACEALAARARRHHIYVCAGLVERSEDFVFNTTVLFGRDGELVGSYRKVHPYWPEEMWEGLTPGCEFPVFDLDFATVGVMTCYDSWFPETSRLLALKGAEVILFPSAGYHPPLLPARAVDNRAFVVASSLNSPAMVVDTLGVTLAETDDGVVTAEIDLAQRPTPHPNAGGSLNTSPGGRRGTRNAASDFVYEELAAEMRRWDRTPAERNDYVS